jgi:hypothetical protein
MIAMFLPVKNENAAMRQFAGWPRDCSIQRQGCACADFRRRVNRLTVLMPKPR